MITDTHCHLGQYTNPTDVLRESRANSIAIVVATESPDEYRRLTTQVGGRTDIKVGLGLHPAGPAIRMPGQLSRFFRLLPGAVWISEVGLDYTHASPTDKRNQNDVLDAILSHGLVRSKIVSLHSRRAADDVVAQIAANPVRAVLHWFSGSKRAADRAVELGAFFSINESMLASDKGGALVDRLPLSSLLLETDGPFAKTRGRPATPSDLTAAIPRLARRRGIDNDECLHHLEANFARLTSVAVRDRVGNS